MRRSARLLYTRKVLGLCPGGATVRGLQPRHPEQARHLIPEAKQGRAWLVLGWQTTREGQVL